MLNIKLNLVGTKQPKQIKISNRSQLLKQIQTIYNINPSTIIIMKPQIKDQQTFKKNVKQGITILFKGSKKIILTKQQQSKLQQLKLKQIKALQQAKKKVQQMNINDHQKIIDKLIKQNIQQRGFSFMNQHGFIQKLNTDHYTSPVHLMRIVPQFYKFCTQYKIQSKNPDGLLIQQLGKTFKLLNGYNLKIVDPLDWCSSFLAYCSDDIDYPYPTYDLNSIIQKILTTIKNAYLTSTQKTQHLPLPPQIKYPPIFTITQNIKKTKLTKLDDDDFDYNNQLDKKQQKYLLQCDISTSSITTYQQGIKKRFQQICIFQSFYLFDLQFKSKIINIDHNPKYLFIHLNRIGYPISKDFNQQPVLLYTPKSHHRVRTKAIIDITDISSNALKDKFQNGKFQKYQIFYKLAEQQGYLNFLNKLKKQHKGINIQQQYSDSELKYMYFDQKLLNFDIFHEYYFDQLKGAKPTGEYRIIGVVYHKGQYYHHPDSTHTLQTHGHTKQNCRGQFMVMVYKHGKQWLKFYDAQIQKIDINQVLHQKYWGGGQWTPTLCLYRQIYIKNIQIQIMGDD